MVREGSILPGMLSFSWIHHIMLHVTQTHMYIHFSSLSIYLASVKRNDLAGKSKCYHGSGFTTSRSHSQASGSLITYTFCKYAVFVLILWKAYCKKTFKIYSIKNNNKKEIALLCHSFLKKIENLIPYITMQDKYQNHKFIAFWLTLKKFIGRQQNNTKEETGVIASRYG